MAHELTLNILEMYNKENNITSYFTQDKGYYSLLGSYYGVSFSFGLKDHPEWFGYEDAKPEITQIDVEITDQDNLTIYVREKTTE